MRELELAPSFAVPLSILASASGLVTLFAVAFVVLWRREATTDLGIGAAIGLILASVSWLCLFRAWALRRRFAAWRLVSESALLVPGHPFRFRIDPGREVERSGPPEFALRYESESRRVGGRKRYREGPFSLDVAVRCDPAATGSRGLAGEFTVPPDQIQIEPSDENWDNRTLVTLTMRVPGGPACRFELPCSAAPELSAS